MLNIIIAIGHIIGLFWMDKMFAISGVSKEMNELARIHSSLPFILTIIAALAFFIFGLYAFSAVGKLKELPFLKVGVFAIAGLYLFRGIGEQSFNLLFGSTNTSETIQSVIAIFIGGLYLFGGLKNWNPKSI